MPVLLSGAASAARGSPLAAVALPRSKSHEQHLQDLIMVPFTDLPCQFQADLLVDSQVDLYILFPSEDLNREVL